MKKFFVFFASLVVFIFVANLDAQAQKSIKSATVIYPWQLRSIGLKADDAWYKNQPNPNDPNIKFSRAHYKRAAKKAKKESIKLVKKASPTARPKTKKAYEKKYYRDAKALGINIKKNRRDS